METVVWLWLYDRRWFFGIKSPSLLKIWTVPLVNNAFYFISLFYYTLTHGDHCYSGFESWIYTRLLMLTLIIVGIVLVYMKTSKNKQEDYREMTIYKSVSPVLLKNYNYWITRKVLISFPGLSLLLLGLLNWIWIAHGMKMAYAQYGSGELVDCGSFIQNVVWGNLVLSGIITLPVLWVLFWMVFIKGTCLILGVVSPSLLISLKKKTAGYWNIFFDLNKYWSKGAGTHRNKRNFFLNFALWKYIYGEYNNRVDEVAQK